MDDNLVIQRLILVNATTNLDILPLHLCNACVTSDTFFNIRAEVQGRDVDSTGTTVHFFHYNGDSNTSRSVVHPLLSLVIIKDDYVGTTLPIGDYTVTAQATSVTGEKGPVLTEMLSILS